jgi:hypothetical protein
MMAMESQRLKLRMIYATSASVTPRTMEIESRRKFMSRIA